MSMTRYFPQYSHGHESAAVSCVRFFEQMEAKHPGLFQGPRGMLQKNNAMPGRRPAVVKSEVEEMVRRFRKGESCEQIAAALDRCTPTIYQHLQARGLRFPGRRKAAA